MTSMTITGKGQFTINKQLLAHLGVKIGEQVVVTKLPDNSLKITAEKNRKNFFDLIGSLKTDVHLTNEELEAAIQKARLEMSLAGLK
jgi:bifunctional DNA-binding transcriptional regulator/antitoxin component of YhaV-PrlF toxin-antitoxin module